jgi:hypothetical protein
MLLFIFFHSLDVINNLPNSSGYNHFAYHVNLLMEFAPPVLEGGQEQPKLLNKEKLVLSRGASPASSEFATKAASAKSARFLVGNQSSVQATKPRTKMSRAQSTWL